MQKYSAFKKICSSIANGYILNQVKTFEKYSIHIYDQQCRFYSEDYLTKAYDAHKALWMRKKLPESINSSDVFVSNELDLQTVDIYGFDYDYTLANYEPTVENLLYTLGRDCLIEKFKYPEEIRECVYNPKFAVRGLHYDIKHGLLMKLDQFQQIQMGSIYRGLTPLSSKEVLDIYGFRTLPLTYIEGHLQGTPQMSHLADLFSLPEMCLLSQVTQYFMSNNLSYHTVALFNDVKAAVGSIHPKMHRIVGANISQYLKKEPNLETFFKRLKDTGKKIFIITNSPFHFVNSGMSYLLGSDWRDYFDVVIADAKKPSFFAEGTRPFRELDVSGNVQRWGPVKQLEKGKIYLEGNLLELQRLKQWKGGNVLYFGDHPYSDLADVTLNHCWRTAAIIWELDHELECLNNEQFKETIGWLQMLQGLIESCQDYRHINDGQIIEAWEKERDQLRDQTKDMFNDYFGSVFRTHENPTYFSRRLFRFADIYTSRLSNLNNYSGSHTFYPRRGVLPHEYKSLFV